jgi:membrane protein DedA with SNARE-associated domain
MESVAFIQWCLNNLNYFTVTILMAIESSFIPLPSEIVVPPAAYKAAVTGDLNVFLVVLFATFGADCGSLINYGLARYLGRPIIYKIANSRVGHALFLNAEKVQHVEAFFNRHGAVSIFTGRLLPAVRHLISIPAGLSKMNLRSFILYTTLGAGIWNTVLAALGYFIPYFVPSINTEAKLIAEVTKYSHEIGYGLLICILIILAIPIYRAVLRKTKEKVTSEEEKDDESIPEE